MPVDYNANVMHDIIGNAHFKVMQIPLLAGREFGPQDTATSPHVAIISESMARTLFPAGPVVGRTYSIGDPNNPNNSDNVPLEEEVIGVAKDAKSRDLESPANYADYLPYTQRAWRFGNFEVRYTGDFGAVSREVQEAIHSVGRRLPITDVETLDQEVANSYIDQTIIAELSAFFRAGGSVSVVHRALWPDVVPRQPADERDWNPHGAGCGPCRSGMASYARDGAAGSDWNCRRAPDDAGRLAVGAKDALRSQGNRSA